MVTFESRVLKICESLKNYVFSGNVLGVGCMKKGCMYSLWQRWYIFLKFMCMSLLHDGIYADYMHFWYLERSDGPVCFKQWKMKSQVSSFVFQTHLYLSHHIASVIEETHSVLSVGHFE